MDLRCAETRITNVRHFCNPGSYLPRCDVFAWIRLYIRSYTACRDSEFKKERNTFITVQNKNKRKSFHLDFKWDARLQCAPDACMKASQLLCCPYSIMTESAQAKYWGYKQICPKRFLSGCALKQHGRASFPFLAVIQTWYNPAAWFCPESRIFMHRGVQCLTCRFSGTEAKDGGWTKFWQCEK